MDDRDRERLIREHTRVQPAPCIPELRLLLADRLVPLWQATEWCTGSPQPPPFWAFAWPGSRAIGRYLVDQPRLVAGRRVLDFAAGSGLAAIVAARLGAAHVLAADVDPLAAVAQRLNADINGVRIETTLDDQVGRAVTADVVLAGDVCYDRAESERVVPWLRLLAASGALVLLADPGRRYAPADHLQLLVSYDLPTLDELESTSSRSTSVWRVLPSDQHL